MRVAVGFSPRNRQKTATSRATFAAACFRCGKYRSATTPPASPEPWAEAHGFHPSSLRDDSTRYRRRTAGMTFSTLSKVLEDGASGPDRLLKVRSVAAVWRSENSGTFADTLHVP